MSSWQIFAWGKYAVIIDTKILKTGFINNNWALIVAKILYTSCEIPGQPLLDAQ